MNRLFRFGILSLACVIVLAGCGKKDKKKIDVSKEKEEVAKVTNKYISYDLPANASKITGLACDNYNKRPFAIMYSGDERARQYFANLSQADFVLEMPHRPMHGQPRLMGIFQCNTPEIVGPMRSGRIDHLSVADSFGAIFVPWGGSSVTKAFLGRKIIDHIDCNGEIAPSGGNACFRRSGPMTPLEKASTNVNKLIEVAKKAGYDTNSKMDGFNHQGEISRDKRPAHGRIVVKFQRPYRVTYEYDPRTNDYKRFIFGKPDIDFETKTQYAPKNIITIITKKESWYSEKDYTAAGLEDPWKGVDTYHRKNDNGQYPNMQLGDPWFDTKFEGEARIFMNGAEIKGTWKKEKGVAKGFKFYDKDGDEIYFVPGQIWMHVLGHDKHVSYEDAEEYDERIKDEAALKNSVK